MLRNENSLLESSTALGNVSGRNDITESSVSVEYSTLNAHLLKLLCNNLTDELLPEEEVRRINESNTQSSHQFSELINTAQGDCKSPSPSTPITSLMKFEESDDNGCNVQKPSSASSIDRIDVDRVEETFSLSQKEDIIKTLLMQINVQQQQHSVHLPSDIVSIGRLDDDSETHQSNSRRASTESNALGGTSQPSSYTAASTIGNVAISAGSFGPTNIPLSPHILHNAEIIENSLNNYITNNQQQKEYKYVSSTPRHKDDKNRYGSGNGSGNTGKSRTVVKSSTKRRSASNGSSVDKRNGNFSRRRVFRNDLKALSQLGPPPVELLDDYRK